ncbi:MAG TPA: response regulator [Ktedonobacterales bacterium]|jgi:diguanylate cyclase (GGDEF)-like protein|nr:response regulator [Ktedonobacterales bacterium]
MHATALEVSSPTILVVEDDARVARMLRATLEAEGYNPLVACTGEEGVMLALREDPQLILLDLMLPGMDGFAVVQNLRGNARTAHIPVMVVSARHDAADKVRAFESDVDDYLTKPFNGDELLARIRTQLRHVQQLQLSPLTGLPAGLRVERAIEDRLAEPGCWSILYLDLDNFKAYNDVYGFVRGNDLIRLLGRTINATMRELGGSTDFLGHVGGDDFILLTSPERVDSLCKQIIARWDTESRAYYSPEDRERGTLIAVDRLGQRQTYPLVALSIGVVTNERRPITSLAEVSRIAAEVKRAAKSMPGSCWYVDRRASDGLQATQGPDTLH